MFCALLREKLVFVMGQVDQQGVFQAAQNAAIRTVLYRMLAPVRWTLKRVSH